MTCSSLASPLPPGDGSRGGQDYYHSVAVVKRGGLPHVRTMDDLRGAKACFAKVGSLAGWTVPIHRLNYNVTRLTPYKQRNLYCSAYKGTIDFFAYREGLTLVWLHPTRPSEIVSVFKYDALPQNSHLCIFPHTKDTEACT